MREWDGRTLPHCGEKKINKVDNKKKSCVDLSPLRRPTTAGEPKAYTERCRLASTVKGMKTTTLARKHSSECTHTNTPRMRNRLLRPNFFFVKKGVRTRSL